MEQYIDLLANNLIIRVVFLAIFLDTVLGVLRAIKERKFNSGVGIDGAIRKVAMVLCVAILLLIDMWFKFDLLFLVPDNIVAALHLNKIGISEFFSVLFIVYEITSILKNMLLCGLPIPKKWREKLENLLDVMTDEMPSKE